MLLSIAGGAIGAIGALQSANATAASADFNAEVAKDNATAIAHQTEATIRDKRVENRRTMGTLRASYGMSGLQLDGSPLDVLEDTAVEQAYDVAKIRYQGRVKAVGQSQQAALFKAEAKSAKKAGIIGAGSALIGGFTSALNNASKAATAGGAGSSYDFG
jgi:hypothetical protein